MTRFSYFGHSGFKSGFSQDPTAVAGALFARDRLELRLALFKALPLASLGAQTDRRFHLFVLCSTLMPKWALRALRKACRAALPDQNFTISVRGPGHAGACLRRFLRLRQGDGAPDRPVFQLVLDDDDALADDFLAVLRPRMAGLAPPAPQELRFVSHACGYALVLRDHKAARLRLYRHRYPFINLGLAMVGPADGPNILTIAHRKTPRDHGHLMIGRGPAMFIRCVHDANDSRVAESDSWREVADWRAAPDITARFGFLTGV